MNTVRNNGEIQFNTQKSKRKFQDLDQKLSLNAGATCYFIVDRGSLQAKRKNVYPLKT